MSPEEIAKHAWSYALKHNATFIDVLRAAGVLIQSVARNSDYSAAALATALLKKLAAEAAEKP